MSIHEIGGVEPIDVDPQDHPTIILPTPVAIQPTITPPDLRITTSGFDNRQVNFILSKEVSDQAGIGHGDKVVLIFDSAYPNSIGLTWDRRHTNNRRTPRYMRYSPQSKGYWLVTLYPDQVQAFLREDLVATNVAVDRGRPCYEPTITLDPRAQTIWFPLPHGRSIHLLRRYFGYFPDLDSLVSPWFSSSFIGLDVALRFLPNGDRYLSFKDSSGANIDVEVSIPDELLQDPIRNGSCDKVHGFNPWNPVQHLMITDYLDTEIKPQVLGL